MKTVCIIMLGSTLHALLATIISFIIGLPGAYCLARYALPYKKWLLSLCTIAAMIPTKLVAASLVLWFHASGSWAIITAYCMLNIPFVIAVCEGMFRYHDVTIEELAWDAGATWTYAYRSVVLPVLWPSLRALAGLIFILCFTNVSIPLILGSHPWHYTFDMMLYESHAAALYDDCALYGVLRIIIKGCILYTCTAGSISVIPQISHAQAVRTLPLHKAWYVYWIAILIFLSAPWITMVRALWYWILNGHQYAPLYDALLHSAQGACIGGSLAVIIGYGVLLLSLEKRRHLIAIITMIPFLLGSVGCGIVALIGVQCGMYSAASAAIIAYGFLYYPYVFRILNMHMPLYDARWHEIARSYGATRLDIQRYHLLPFLQDGLLRAWYIVCILGFTEVGAGAVLAQQGWITIPVLMRQHISDGQYDAAWGLYGLTVAVVLALWLALYGVMKAAGYFLIFLRWVPVFVKRQDVGL
jgi:ABC-type Fe3+ transport system permease subunit